MLNLRITATGYKEKTNIRVQNGPTAPQEQVSRPFLPPLSDSYAKVQRLYNTDICQEG
jgi:hypothetical protein